MSENTFVNMPEKIAKQLQAKFDKEPENFILNLPKLCFRLFTVTNWINMQIAHAFSGDIFLERLSTNFGAIISILMATSK